MVMQLQIKYLVFLLIIGVLLKVTQFLFPQNQLTVEIIILFIGLLFTGIPHGAIDHYVAKKNADNQQTSFNLFYFIIRYVLFMLIYGCFWWLLPGMSLCFFILLTAFHFGETDLHYFDKDNKFFAFLYGLCITAWLLLPHEAALIKWLQLIIPQTDTVFILTHYLFKIPPIIFLAVSCILSFPKRNKQKVWLLFIVMLVLVNQLGLIGGFAFYFSGWHGWMAFNDIRNHIQSNEKIASLWKKAIPFTLLAFVFLIVVYLVTPSSVWQMFGAPAFIIMISLLTLPHMQIMHSIYNRNK
jgi:Brp/Blh family beta-carotene 15,15'-monooxygenase